MSSGDSRRAVRRHLIAAVGSPVMAVIKRCVIKGVTARTVLADHRVDSEHNVTVMGEQKR